MHIAVGHEFLQTRSIPGVIWLSSLGSYFLLDFFSLLSYTTPLKLPVSSMKEYFQIAFSTERSHSKSLPSSEAERRRPELIEQSIVLTQSVWLCRVEIDDYLYVFLTKLFWRIPMFFYMYSSLVLRRHTFSVVSLEHDIKVLTGSMWMILLTQSVCSSRLASRSIPLETSPLALVGLITRLSSLSQSTLHNLISLSLLAVNRLVTSQPSKVPQPTAKELIPF